MRWLVLWAGFVSSAFAADTESGWLASDAESKRFFGEAVAGPTFTAGTKVTVLVHDGETVRIFAGDRFGWVPASAITSTPPKGAEAGTPGMPDIKLVPAGAEKPAPPKP